MILSTLFLLLVCQGDSQPGRNNQVSLNLIVITSSCRSIILLLCMQDIAEIAKFYELLFQAMDQRMNVENVKRSGQCRKGVSDVIERTDYSEEFRIRH